MKFSKSQIRKLLKISRITSSVLKEFGARTPDEFYRKADARLSDSISRRAERVNRVYVRFVASVRVIYEAEKKISKNGREAWEKIENGVKRMDFDKVIVDGTQMQHIQQMADEYIRNVELKSGYRNAELIDIIYDVTETMPSTVIPLRNIPMREARAPELDNVNKYFVDSKQGRCVIDYLQAKYGAVMKKDTTTEKLVEYFKQHEVWHSAYGFQDVRVSLLLDGDTIKVSISPFQYDPLLDGVSTVQLESWCASKRVPMYAMDEDGEFFSLYQPEKPRKDIAPLMYRMLNRHMYPVDDPKERKSIQERGRLVKSDNTKVTFQNNDEKDQKKKENDPDVIAVENVDPLKFLCEKIKEVGKIPYPACKQIMYRDGSLQQFTLDGKTYIINQDINKCKSIIENLGIEWKQQSLSRTLFEIVEKVTGKAIPKSHLNPEVIDSLLLDGVKNRAHYGLVNGYEPQEIISHVANNNATVYDISKCYTACMYEPYDEWYLCDFNDHWVPFDGKITDGFYFVETQDTLLFHGSNIYSRAMVQKGIDEGIPMKIVKKLPINNTLPKTYFKNIIDEVKRVCGDDISTFKFMCNMLSGYLGKHETHTYKMAINSNMEQLWNWVQRKVKENDKIIIHRLPIDESNTCFLYGQQSTYTLTDNNLPMYIQIKDFSNIRLYDMVKAMGGKLAFRKTDLAVCIRGKTLTEGNGFGAYRQAELPLKMGVQNIQHVIVPDSMPWLHDNEEIHDSDQSDEVFKSLEENKGLLLCGRAGTGKTHVIRKVCEKIVAEGKRFKILCPTNKAALVAGGVTVHKFLKLDKEMKVSKVVLESIKKNYEYIIVDEISMIDKNVWKRLYELKDYTGCTVMLVGDYRQCAPVENEKIDHYFDHSVVKYLSNGNRIELKTPKRYDMELWDRLEKVMDAKNKTIGNGEEHRRSISYFNRTRKRVNRQWMLKEKPEDAVFAPCNIVDPDEYIQDAWLYKGLPIISRVTKKDDTLINNETFVIESATQERFVAVSERAGDEGQKEEHRIECDTPEFHKLFLVNYCSTTHKCQGETILEKYTIYDWNHMSERLKYTALSRAKNIGQVSTINTEKCKEDEDNAKKHFEKKLAGHLAYDTEHGYENDLTTEFCYRKFIKQGGMCAYCSCDMLISGFKSGDSRQATIDRYYNNKGHKCDNVCISCWGCNRSRKNEK